MKWISVEEGLPPLNTWVIVYIPSETYETIAGPRVVQMGYAYKQIDMLYKEDGSYGVVENGVLCWGVSGGVTHWMHPPKPPKGKQ